MKIALLCNNRLAIPAIQKLVAAGTLCAIGISDTQQEVVTVLSERAKELKMPLKIFSKMDFAAGLETWLAETCADAVFVMTFPWRIPKHILSIPGYGFLNFHYGLLPEMRGPDPIYEAIKQQRSKAGVTVHKMDEGFDTGDVIIRREIQVPPHFTYGLLSTQLAYLGADLSLELLQQMNMNGQLDGIAQNEQSAQYWPKAQVKDLFINWENMDSTAITSLVNACNPILRSGAATSINGWGIGVCFASPVNLAGDTTGYKAGTILAMDHQNGLLVFCSDGKALKLDVVHTEEGFFPGYMLGIFGISAGMSFN